MAKKLKIVSISSEVAPFSKTGGLADVARSLPKAIKRLGHEIIVITPLYGKVIDIKIHNLKLLHENVKVIISDEETTTVNYWQGYLMEDLPIYFIENKKYFSKKNSLYGSQHENLRFYLFNLAALKLLILLKFKADIIHCHDWHTGLIPYLLKTDFKDSVTLKNSKTIFTIHNLVFQMGCNWWEVPAEKKDYGKHKLPAYADPEVEYINFAKRGILTADVINTVSEQYREEIMTKKFGQYLHTILRNRSDRLFGIINGIDYNAFNPEIDPLIYKNYNYSKPGNKQTNKKYLQKKLGLPINSAIPLICATSRVTFQKGFELIIKLLEPLSRFDIQLVIMGDGDKQYINDLKKFSKKYPKKIKWIPYTGNQELENLIYAGSDIFILPSHHEPCGINQLIAMRYGCIPVVRRVGGLYDTVKNFNPLTNRGSGFTFNHFDHFSLFATIIRALETFKYKNTWNALIIRAMKESNSWEIPAKKYIELYKKALKL